MFNYFSIEFIINFINYKLDSVGVVIELKL